MLKYNCQKQPSCNSHYTNNLEINFKNLKKIFFTLIYSMIQIGGFEFGLKHRLCFLHSSDRNNDIHLNQIIPV